MPLINTDCSYLDQMRPTTCEKGKNWVSHKTQNVSNSLYESGGLKNPLKIIADFRIPSTVFTNNYQAHECFG